MTDMTYALDPSRSDKMPGTGGTRYGARDCRRTLVDKPPGYDAPPRAGRSFDDWLAAYDAMMAERGRVPAHPMVLRDALRIAGFKVGEAPRGKALVAAAAALRAARAITTPAS